MRRVPLIIAAALSIVGAAVVSGQVPSTKQGPPQNIVSRAVRASLRGMVLTPAEQASLKTVSVRYAPRFKTIGDSATPAIAALRAARAAHDTAAAHAARRNLLAVRRSGTATLRKSLLDVRAALTPEHQAHFDANMPKVRRMLRQHATRVPRNKPPTS